MSVNAIRRAMHANTLLPCHTPQTGIACPGLSRSRCNFLGSRGPASDSAYIFPPGVECIVPLPSTTKLPGSSCHFEVEQTYPRIVDSRTLAFEGSLTAGNGSVTRFQLISDTAKCATGAHEVEMDLMVPS
jgi:hypothetical protein